MVRVGTAGWLYKDWEGIVYPKPKPRGFDPLTYLAGFFDTVEINTSFYGPPRPDAARAWVERVVERPGFRFTLKLWKGFTHDRNATRSDVKLFRDGLEPIAASGRLGALLLQFPWSYRNEAENRSYLWRLQEQFAEYPLVLEVRHASWIEPALLDTLAELGVGICNIDQPLFARSVKPAAHVTSNVGYIRLHGRNYRNWFAAKADVRERYDHLYSLEELEPWADRVKAVDGEARETFAITNNHNLGKAVVNAFELKTLLGQPVNPPLELVKAYQELIRVRQSGRGSE